MNRVLILAFLFQLACSSYLIAQTSRQEIKKIGTFAGEGIVEDFQPGEITIRRKDGKQKSFLIQNKGERFVSLDGNDYIVPMPAKINVYGTLPGKLLERGMIVQFSGEINRSGRTGKAVKDLKVISGDKDQLLIEPATLPSGKAMVPCDFVGIIQRFTNQRMYLVVPRTNMSPTERISVKVADDAMFDIQAEDLNRVREGDKVISFKGDTMDNGAMVIREIEIELNADREVATTSFSDQLYLKHSKLSDKPAGAREERSANFVLYTDISPRSSRVLLDKLETMHGFLSRYYRKKPKEPIVCYVVTDLDNFSKIPPVGVQKIAEKAGVTVSQQFALMKGNRVKGKQTTSTVYSCDDHGVVQHEAVHAFCSMAFGTAGPVWYAEGMAEMGQYWEPEQKAIHIEPVVIEYLTTAKKKEMADIVAAGQITGDSWKAYSWRWALCHLLANNPTYSKRFHNLGTNLMAEKSDSFDKAFGDVKKKISFEYDQFVANFDNGYRTDLCVWQWPEEAKPIKKNASFNVNAKQGWQATSLILDKNSSYDFVCPATKDDSGKKKKQSWKIKSTKTVSPNGNHKGDGRLIGVILSNYELSEPFEIGSKKAKFTPPESGQLYVRCQEKWNAIADNEGTIKVFVRKTPKQ